MTQRSLRPSRSLGSRAAPATKSLFKSNRGRQLIDRCLRHRHSGRHWYIQRNEQNRGLTRPKTLLFGFMPPGIDLRPGHLMALCHLRHCRPGVRHAVPMLRFQLKCLAMSRWPRSVTQGISVPTQPRQRYSLHRSKSARPRCFAARKASFRAMAPAVMGFHGSPFLGVGNVGVCAAVCIHIVAFSVAVGPICCDTASLLAFLGLTRRLSSIGAPPTWLPVILKAGAPAFLR